MLGIGGGNVLMRRMGTEAIEDMEALVNALRHTGGVFGRYSENLGYMALMTDKDSDAQLYRKTAACCIDAQETAMASANEFARLEQLMDSASRMGNKNSFKYLQQKLRVAGIREDDGGLGQCRRTVEQAAKAMCSNHKTVAQNYDDIMGEGAPFCSDESLGSKRLEEMEEKCVTNFGQLVKRNLVDGVDGDVPYDFEVISLIGELKISLDEDFARLENEVKREGGETYASQLDLVRNHKNKCMRIWGKVRLQMEYDNIRTLRANVNDLENEMNVMVDEFEAVIPNLDGKLNTSHPFENAFTNLADIRRYIGK